MLSAERNSESNLQVDLGLASGGDFVMMALYLKAAALHGQHHLGAQVLVMVSGWDGKIAFLVAGTVAEVVFQRGLSSSVLLLHR